MSGPGAHDSKQGEWWLGTDWRNKSSPNAQSIQKKSAEGPINLEEEAIAPAGTTRRSPKRTKRSKQESVSAE